MLAGALTLDAAVSTLAGLNLIDAGSIAVAGKAPNVLGGDWSIGAITLDGVAELQFDGSLAVDDVSVDDSLLQIGSLLTVDGFVNVSNNGEVFAVEIVFGPGSLTRLIIDPDAGSWADVSAVGLVTRAGELIVDLASPFPGPDPVAVVAGLDNLGSFDASLIGPGADSAELVQDAAGVRLVPVAEVPAFVLTGIESFHLYGKLI